ncbi:predicted protein [Paramuricea clavata]|uniref:Uncharacterized protein n=1 Tax=Paramuricea clavata TaxID=317549 RepID=A0A7D9DYM0_PARCT|nr:predicted protein [Paramuricea clavata]
MSQKTKITKTKMSKKKNNEEENNETIEDSNTDKNSDATKNDVTSGSSDSSSETESTTDENGNNCGDEECHKIYDDVGHIKQRVGDERILGSKAQFCAAFYHVHEWNFGKRQHYCLDETNCIIAKRVSANNNNWSLQALNVVAVVKFEDENGIILYEGRYTNCGKEQKHAEDFFKDDIENGELTEKVKANQNGTITLYLTYQPCNKSTEGTANTPADKTCCETLTTVFEGILRQNNISLCVKAANTSRLSLTKETDAVKEKLRNNAVEGIKELMRIGVNISEMTPEDWDYLVTMTEDFLPRRHLDKTVQSVLERICARINKRKTP